MKYLASFTTTLSLFIIFIFFSACNHSGITKLPSPKKERSATINASSNCLRDYRISKGVAEMAKKFYSITLENWPDYTGNTTNQVNFQHSAIQSLLDQCPSCEGIRVYFGYSNAGVGIPNPPSLLMVNTLACNDYLDREKPILLSSIGEETASLISENNAATMTTNWRNALENNQLSGWVYDTIYAYTFQRSQFEDYLNHNSGIPLEMNLALKTTNEIITSINGGFGEEVHGAFQLHLILEGYLGNASISFMDMAIPCPRDCGDPSPLLPEPENR